MKEMIEEAVRVLIVDDDPKVRRVLKRLLSLEGMEPIEASDGESALEIIRLRSPDLVLLDIRKPGVSGEKTLQQIRVLDRDVPVIIITGYGTIRDAVQRLKDGAYDYLTKPFDNDEVLLTIRQALNKRQLKKRRKRVTNNIKTEASLSTLMGYSEVVSQLIFEVSRVAPTDFSVLITGETGVGKEIVAREIHRKSNRQTADFVAVDCGAIPETLMEKELFGHEKGSFTGADSTMPGKFEAANSGTLFLDEISNLPFSMQGKLLRVLQERGFFRVGGNSIVNVDVRIVTATNLDLSTINNTNFRRDLYHRLIEYVIHIPPLRERKKDIIYLAKRFLDQTNEELGKRTMGFSKNIVEHLLMLDWPGNVRELRNVIRRAVLLADDEIKLENLVKLTQTPQKRNESTSRIERRRNFSLKAIVQQSTATLEKVVLEETLLQTGWNKAEAARSLQIDYKTLLNKLKLYKLINRRNP